MEKVRLSLMGERRYRIEVIHHFPETLYVQLVEPPPPPVTSAVRATLTMSGDSTMPITVGQTITATVSFVDASGAPTSAPAGDGSGLVYSFASSDTSQATINPDAGNPAQGDVTFVGETPAGGTGVSFTATVGNASGSPLLDADGVTPLTQPEPSPVYTVVPGPATAAVLTMSEQPS
jgi:hypothetical protein